MKPSATKNKTTATGFQYVLVELGDFLFFGGTEFYKVTHFRNGRPMSNNIDLIELEKVKGLPIVFEK